MQQRIHIRPAAGLLVRDPVTQAHLPAEGRSVPRSQYWLRRLAAGDVEIAKAPTKRPAKGKE